MALAYEYRERDPVEEDSCTREGAQRLQQKIEDYWRMRGHTNIQFDLREVGFVPSMRSARVDLRSTMRNGYPPPKLAAVL